jgi:hypothetical protein
VTALTGAVYATGGSVTRHGTTAVGAIVQGGTSLGATYHAASGTPGEPGYTHRFYSGGTNPGFALPTLQVLGGYSSAPQAAANFAQIGNGGAGTFESATLSGSNGIKGTIAVSAGSGVTLTGGYVSASVTNFAFVTSLGAGAGF